MTTIDLKDYLRWSPGWQEHLPETARRGLLPAAAVPRPGAPPGVSEDYGTAASAAKAGLAGSTALSRVILAGVDPAASPPEGSGAPGAAAPGVAAPRGGAELLRWLGSESETLLRRLPPAARGYVEALRPLAESAVEPLSAAGRQESVAGLSQALSGQLAVLRRLAAVGAPLEPLLAVARGQLGALRQAGLLPGGELAYETQVLEEIAAERLRGRIGRDAGLLAGTLEGQPEAAHLSAETLAALEDYRGEQVQAQAAARGERLLTGLLRGAAAGEAPAPEARVQLAELGLSDVSGLDLVPLLEGEAQVAEARRDPLALVLERYPPLKMLERMTGRGGLYRRALVTAQRAAGVPEGEIRVWDRAEGEAATAAWLSLPPETAAEPERVNGLLGFTRDHLAGLPPEFQAYAVAELVRQGLPEADANALLAVGRELASGRGIAAKGLAKTWVEGGAETAAGHQTPVSNRSPGAAVSAGYDSILAERQALLNSFDGLALPDLKQTYAAIERLFPDDPKMQRELRGLASQAVADRGEPADASAPVWDLWRGRRDELLNDLPNYVSPFEGRHEGRRAVEERRAGDEGIRQAYADWSRPPDREDGVAAGYREQPDSGQVVFWDSETDLPVMGADKKPILLDAATAELLGPQGLSNMSADTKTFHQLAVAFEQAQGAGVGAIDLGEIAFGLENGFQHLSALRLEGKEILLMIQRGQIEPEQAAALFESLSAKLRDPRTYVAQKEISQYFSKTLLGEIERRAKIRGENIQKLDKYYGELHDIAYAVANKIKEFRQEGLTEEEIAELLKVIPEMTELSGTIHEIAKTNISILRTPDHPHPELDPEGVATLHYLQNRQFAGEKIVRFLIEDVAPVVIGLSHPVLAMLLSAGLAYDKASNEWRATGTRKMLEDAGVDLTDEQAIGAYISANESKIMENEQNAVMEGVTALISSLASDFITEVAFEYISSAISGGVRGAVKMD